jgi:hypothetical protein
MAPLV